MDRQNVFQNDLIETSVSPKFVGFAQNCEAASTCDRNASNGERKTKMYALRRLAADAASSSRPSISIFSVRVSVSFTSRDDLSRSSRAKSRLSVTGSFSL